MLSRWLAALVVAPAMPVEWDAPAGCPDAAQLRERIAAQSDVPPDDVQLEVVGSIRAAEGGGFVLEVETYGPDTVDRREMEGDSCEALTDAAALIVALRLTAAAEVVVPDAPETAEPPAPIETTTALAEPRAPAPTPVTTAPIAQPLTRERSRVNGFVGGAGGVALGVLPSVGGAVRVEGGIEGRHYRVGLTVRSTPVRRAEPSDLLNVRGRLDMINAGVLGCGVPLAGPVAFPICGRVLAGGVRATGDRGVDEAQPRWSAWVGGAVSAAASWRLLRSLALFVEAEAVFGFVRPGFTVGMFSRTLYRLRIPGFRAWAGIEWRPHFGARQRAEAQT